MYGLKSAVQFPATQFRAGLDENQTGGASQLSENPVLLVHPLLKLGEKLVYLMIIPVIPFFPMIRLFIVPGCVLIYHPETHVMPFTSCVVNLLCMYITLHIDTYLHIL